MQGTVTQYQAFLLSEKTPSPTSATGPCMEAFIALGFLQFPLDEWGLSFLMPSKIQVSSSEQVPQSQPQHGHRICDGRNFPWIKQND